MRKRREVKQGILLGVLAIAAIWLVTLLWGLGGKAQIAISKEESVKREYDTLEDRKRSLTATLAELETPRGQDEAIRTAFDVARPGEEVIVVVPPASSTASTTKGFWQRLGDWF